jgi:hypothetical protein
MGATAYSSWRSAAADDAEWMSGKFRARLAQDLDRSFLMDVGPTRVVSVDSAETALEATTMGIPRNNSHVRGW